MFNYCVLRYRSLQFLWTGPPKFDIVTKAYCSRILVTQNIDQDHIDHRICVHGSPMLRFDFASGPRPKRLPRDMAEVSAHVASPHRRQCLSFIDAANYDHFLVTSRHLSDGRLRADRCCSQSVDVPYLTRIRIRPVCDVQTSDPAGMNDALRRTQINSGAHPKHSQIAICPKQRRPQTLAN